MSAYKRTKLGENIYKLRSEMGLSQSELGRLIGVSNKAVSKWETYETSPSIDLLPNLAAALNTTIDNLLGTTIIEKNLTENDTIINAEDDVVENEEKIKFELINGGEAYAASRGTKKSDDCSGEIVIPETYMGKPVTQIAAKGFFMCQKLTSVIIPKSIEVIGEQAFQSCGMLSMLDLQDGVKIISKSAFLYCRGLQDVVIPDSVNKIDTNAFGGCEKLKTVTMPQGVELGLGVFDMCPNLDRDFKKQYNKI